MTDATWSKIALRQSEQINGASSGVANRYNFFLPGALVILGVVSSFAWAAFLGWCVLTFVL